MCSHCVVCIGPKGPIGFQGERGIHGIRGFTPQSINGYNGWTGANGNEKLGDYPIMQTGTYENSFIQFDQDTNTWLILSENNIRVGNNAGRYNQENDTIAIGEDSGHHNQQYGAISIGKNAGSLNSTSSQGIKSISIGNNAGVFNSGESSISIGFNANARNGDFSIGIGADSSSSIRPPSNPLIPSVSAIHSIAIGYQAAHTPSNYNISIGNRAGYGWASLGPMNFGSIFIGREADASPLSTDQTIYINGTGSTPSSTPPDGGLFMEPVRLVTDLGGSMMPANSPMGFSNVIYNPSTAEIAYQPYIL